MGLAPIFLCFFHLLHPEVGFCLQFYLFFFFWLSLFPTTSPASPTLGQTSSSPLAASTRGLVEAAGLWSSLNHSPRRCFPRSFILEVDGAEAVPSYASHKLSTPQTAPVAFLPFPASWLQLWELALGACRLEAALWLSPGGEVGGSERCLAAGEEGCWSRQQWLGPTAAHQTCSSAFPCPAELVLVLPETLLLQASDLEISLSPYSWSVASVNKTRGSP